MSLGLILVIILVIFLLGRFQRPVWRLWYGYGHGGIGVIGINPDHFVRTSSHGSDLISRRVVSDEPSSAAPEEQFRRPHRMVEKQAVLGANDGIPSTASLIVGVAAAAATQNAVLIAGVAD